MALFVAAVDGGSLAAAARRHGRSPAAVTRAIALLERHAADTLLLRSTRQLSLTAAGQRHLAVWREVLAQLQDLDPGERRASVQGEVVVTAPEVFGRIAVMPVIDNVMRVHTGVSARVLMLNRVVNLVAEGVDLAIRLAPLVDSTLSAIKVGEVRTVLCASPDYLDRAAPLQTPDDLAHHVCIGLDTTARAELWSFADTAGRRRSRRSVRVEPRLSIDNAAAAIDACLHGHGLHRARSYQVADAIAAGRLRRVLPGWEEAPVPVHLLFPPERAARGAVRALIDQLTPSLRERLAAITATIG